MEGELRKLIEGNSGRIPIWDGSHASWKHHKQDVELWLEEEGPDVKYSLGAKYARRSTFAAPWELLPFQPSRAQEFASSLRKLRLS